ncbi:MAG: flagellar basal body L-ring protein FlgH [Rhodobiaceae bacterium]|nr:flagellar basal body L-ring protein FlgH [Rhodobiaceae bacterium]MCC0012193.1 flagellar basal body L-ring protein FlgH [Rhodobiaceae bacterium]MCC0060892.1 flagellar basal body L-ring protein FlgH [Rhodobiaceae bacterium]
MTNSSATQGARTRRTSGQLCRAVSVVAASMLLAACSVADKLAQVGHEPSLSAIENPTAMPGYRPVTMPMPEPEPPIYNSNALWRTGARAFFRDQRAARVGDILTIRVAISDSAKISNATARERSANDNVSINGAAGLDSIINKLLPSGASASALVDTTTTGSAAGSGSVDRSESIVTNVAAVVTQVLPNGNMVIEGRQEVRVNFEKRELVVAGIVRPEDIGSDNMIDSDKIAEARIAYGGRGQITDVQQPRYGSQVLDILLPF